jgi:hypothetical protein
LEPVPLDDYNIFVNGYGRAEGVEWEQVQIYKHRQRVGEVGNDVKVSKMRS